MDLLGSYNGSKNLKPDYKQTLHIKCGKCHHVIEVDIHQNIDWKARCLHSESAIGYLIGSFNDILKSVEMYEGCAMNSVLREVWKKKLRTAIIRLKNKEFRE